jgi:hypothetical protein
LHKLSALKRGRRSLRKSHRQSTVGGARNCTWWDLEQGPGEGRWNEAALMQQMSDKITALQKQLVGVKQFGETCDNGVGGGVEGLQAQIAMLVSAKESLAG